MQTELYKLSRLYLGMYACIHTYLFIYQQSIKKIEIVNLKETKEGYMVGFREKKGKENYIIVL